MRELGEERTRTSLLVRGSETVLVDCGPDLRIQMAANRMERPDIVLITHEHGDHYLGIDDLLAFRRSMPADRWAPIPVYATELTWKAVEVRFGYLVGSLVEKRVAVPGRAIEGTRMRITPFKTDHGATAAGSVGYVIEDRKGNDHRKIVYTSDFMRLPEEPDILREPDLIVMQSHWLNEPEVNRPYHMSLQRALEYIGRWKPKRGTYIVHVSDGDRVPGDSCNSFLKKVAPLSPLSAPGTGLPYPVPRCAAEWQDILTRISNDFDVPGALIMTRDGLSVPLG